MPGNRDPIDDDDDLPELNLGDDGPDLAALQRETDSILSSRLDPPPIPETLTKPATPAHRSTTGGGDSGMWGMAKAWGTAFDFIFTIIAGAALGWGYDKWRGTAPTGIMIGIGVGFVVAFIRIVRATLKQEREEAKAREARRNP